MSTNDVAVRVEGVGKRYRIGARHDGYRTLRDAVAGVAATPYRRLRSVLGGHAPVARTDTIWALKDVSFEVPAGQAIGIIGRNGAGKSTLLKILSRITEPTEGRAITYGRVGSLLEVGTGFHPELTGRENIYLNGAILGMKRREIDRKLDDIVSFAETERFLDTPVKFYSSGMYVRLAFGVAAHLEPDILVVDEVLAVGDAEFQRKCMGKMGDVAQGGRTVLFVSHNMGAVQSLCPRTILLGGGSIVADGSSRDVIDRYLASANEDQLELRSVGGLDGVSLTVERVVLRNADGEPTTTFGFGDDVTVEVHLRVPQPLRRPYVWIDIGTHAGIFAASMLLDELRPDVIEGDAVIACTFKGVRLLPRSEPFTVHLGVLDQSGSYVVPPSSVSAFRVAAELADIGMSGDRAAKYVSKHGPVVIPYEWRLPDGSIHTPSWCAPDPVP